VAGRRVLDFACGGGICAIAAVRAGAAEVLAHDVDDFCGAAVVLNAEANGALVDFTAEPLLERPPPAFEVIVAGDISYEKPMAERVHAWLRAAAAQGSRVLIGDPGRSYFDPAGLVMLAEYEVPTTRELEDREVKWTGVWTFA
jgi:predicted nicotinamide N-methyase